MRHELHYYEQSVSVLIPAEELDEQLLVLVDTTVSATLLRNVDKGTFDNVARAFSSIE